MTLNIKNKEYQGWAEIIAGDKESVARGLQAFLRKVRFDVRFYKVKFDDDGQPNWHNVQQAAQRCVMLRITLEDPDSIKQHSDSPGIGVKK